jgi:hypothetical protein
MKTEKEIRREAIEYGYRLRKYGDEYRIYDDKAVCLSTSLEDLNDWWTAHGP